MPRSAASASSGRAGRHEAPTRRRCGRTRRRPSRLALDADRVVEVPRIGRVDREREPVAQVDAAGLCRQRIAPASPASSCSTASGHGAATPCVDRHAAQHGRTSSGRPSRSSSAAAAAAVRLDGDQVALRHVAPAPRRPSVSGSAELEERLGDQQPCPGGPPRRRREPRAAAPRRASPAGSAASAASSVSSLGVEYRSGASTVGVTPRPLTIRPPASVNEATVSFSAPPPGSGRTACTVPLP